MRAVCLLLAVGTAVAGSIPCPAADGPITCDSCPQGADVNVMSRLPRINSKGQKVSSNLADYSIISCYGDGSDGAPTVANTSCVLSADLSISNIQTQIMASGGPPANSIASYIQSLGAYAAFGFVCALVCIVFSGCFCFGRVCCCCCRGGCCGKRYPTFARASCKLGFSEVETLLTANTDDKFELAYKPRGRWCTRALMAVYVILTCAFIAVGQIRGNQGITAAMKTIATSPAGIASSVRAMRTPLRSALVSLSADAVHPLLASLNSTVASAINVGRLTSDAQCIISGVRTSIPDANVLIDFIDDANATLASIRDTAGGLNAGLSGISNQLTIAQSMVGYTAGNLSALYVASGVVNATIDSTSGHISSMGAVLNGLKANADGLPAASSQVSTAASNLPSQATADGVRTGAGSLSDLMAGNMDGTSGTSARTTLHTSLTNFAAAITATGNLSATADILLGINVKIAGLRSTRLVDLLVTDIATLGTSLNALPVPQLETSITGVADAINGITVAPIRSALLSFNATLNGGGLPNVTVVLVELAKINGIANIIDCMGGLLNAVRGLNESVVTLPPEIGLVFDIVSMVNASYQQAQSQISSLGSSLSGLDTLTSSFPNITQYLLLVDAISAQLASPPVNLTSIATSLSVASSAQSGVNLASASSGLVTVNASIWDDSIIAPNSLIDGLRSLQALLSTTGTAVSAAATELAAYSAYLRCSNSDTVCSVEGSTALPCTGGNTCVPATPSCTNSWATTCTADSDCSGGGTCPYHAAIYQTAVTALTAYSAAGPNTFATALTTMSSPLSSASTALAASPSMATLQSSLSSARGSLQSIPINASLAALTTYGPAISPSALNLGSITTAVNDAMSFTGAFDLGVIRTQLLSFNESFGSVRDSMGPQLDLVDKFVGVVQTVFTETLPEQMPRLTRTGLAGATTLRAVVLQIADVAQAFIGSASALNFSSSALPNISSLAADNVHLLDALDDSSIAAAGAIYFFTKLAPLSLNTVPAAEAGTTGRIFTDSAGATWSGDRMCLTDSCIVNFIDDINTKPLQLSLIGGSSGSGATTLPLSREMLMFLPFLIPLAIALLGCCGAVGLCGKRWQRCPTCCSAFWMCMVLPWLFIFAGALFFPFIMFASDGCRSAPNLGYQYLHGSAGSICSMLPNGVVDANGGCSMSIAGEDLSLPPVADIFGAVMGSCGAFPTAVPALYGSLAAAARHAPARLVNTTVVDMLSGGGTGLAVKAPITNAIRAFGGNVGGTLAGMVTEVADVLSCEVLHENVGALKDGVCCSAMTAIYWYSSSFYLLAFFACLCGFPASILGYKRFPNALWGPQFAARKAEAGSAGINDDSISRAASESTFPKAGAKGDRSSAKVADAPHDDPGAATVTIAAAAGASAAAGAGSTPPSTPTPAQNPVGTPGPTPSGTASTNITPQSTQGANGMAAGSPASPPMAMAVPPSMASPMGPGIEMLQPQPQGMYGPGGPGPAGFGHHGRRISGVNGFPGPVGPGGMMMGGPSPAGYYPPPARASVYGAGPMPMGSPGPQAGGAMPFTPGHGHGHQQQASAGGGGFGPAGQAHAI